MSDTKVLQAILDGQVSIRKDIKRVEKNLGKKIEVNTKRLDTIGSQVAYLEDDAPTREEHDELEERVTVLEQVSPN